VNLRGKKIADNSNNKAVAVPTKSNTVALPRERLKDFAAAKPNALFLAKFNFH
jgi:hypothetical protein